MHQDSQSQRHSILLSLHPSASPSLPSEPPLPEAKATPSGRSLAKLCHLFSHVVMASPLSPSPSFSPSDAGREERFMSRLFAPTPSSSQWETTKSNPVLVLNERETHE